MNEWRLIKVPHNTRQDLKYYVDKEYTKVKRVKLTPLGEEISYSKIQQNRKGNYYVCICIDCINRRIYLTNPNNKESDE